MECGDCEPHINVTINEDDIVNGAIEVVKVIRPDWPEKLFQHKVQYFLISNLLFTDKFND